MFQATSHEYRVAKGCNVLGKLMLHSDCTFFLASRTAGDLPPSPSETVLLVRMLLAHVAAFAWSRKLCNAFR